MDTQVAIVLFHLVVSLDGTQTTIMPEPFEELTSCEAAGGFFLENVTPKPAGSERFSCVPYVVRDGESSNLATKQYYFRKLMKSDAAGKTSDAKALAQEISRRWNLPSR